MGKHCHPESCQILLQRRVLCVTLNGIEFEFVLEESELMRERQTCLTNTLQAGSHRLAVADVMLK